MSWNLSSGMSAPSVSERGIFLRVFIPMKACHNPIYVPMIIGIYTYLCFRGEICSPLHAIFLTAVLSFYKYKLFLHSTVFK